ncbi:hypothetical protein K438DRAFT_1814390 [Mycena galopus ATCC 62051]|nr:hypothetical protein K438DRAFT_1814390 [Mycena galopus ATCC 62051]
MIYLPSKSIWDRHLVDTPVGTSMVRCSGLASTTFLRALSLAFLSQSTTLEPGSIILTGTLAGVGGFKKSPLYLKYGDKMSVWVGNGIGMTL